MRGSGAGGRPLRWALLAATLLSILAPRGALAADECESPRCRDVRVPLPRGVNVPDNHVRVLLPEGYRRNGARYPVVYVLHGVADTYTTWSQNTDIIGFTRNLRAIIVMPDGGRGSQAGWYSDWKDGSRQWETFHTRVLVRYIDRNYRTLGKRHRGVIGVSMGGFGAMSYAARHEGLFRAAASLSGVVDTMYGFPASGPAFELGGRGIGDQSLGTPTENVWGNQLSDEGHWRAHNPTDRAADLDDVWLFVASGMGTPGGEAGEDPGRPHAYANENFIFQMNLSFTRALDDAGVGYTSDFYSGYHDWPYWQQELHRALPQLLEVIR